MNTKRPNEYEKIFTLVGCMFLVGPSSVPLSWGGMSVYALSFVALRLNTPSSDIEVPWIISLFYIFWTGSLIGSSYIDKLIGRRFILALGSAILVICEFSSYYAIQHSLVLLDISMGAFTGLAAGLLYGSAIQIVVETADNRLGLRTSVLQSSYSIGALINVQVITWYVNPQNKVPTLTLGFTNYFTETEVIEKIPSMFLVLGSITLTCTIIGLTLLQVNPSVRFCNCISSLDEPLISCDTPEVNNKSCSPQNSTKDLSDSSEKLEPTSKTLDDYIPAEILKTAKFWALCISFATADFPFILVTNFYKLYGQVWIHDDHFLTNVGTAFIIVTSLSRVPWGLALDRFGSKPCLVVLLSSSVVTVTWYYFTPMVHKWLYFVATSVYGSFAGAIYSCYLAVTALVFGKTHVATNFGLLMLFCIIINLVAPNMINALLVNFGWFTVYASASAVNLVGLALCFVYVP